MRRRSILLAILSGAFAGCRSLSPFANRSIIAKFDEVDRIEVIAVRETIAVIDDAESISRIKNIYKNARWQPFLDTRPSSFKTFVCKSGDDTVLEFIWSTWLIELDHSGGWVRKAKLDDADQKWMSNITKPTL